jgi:hypothetical protein
LLVVRDHSLEAWSELRTPVLDAELTDDGVLLTWSLSDAAVTEWRVYRSLTTAPNPDTAELLAVLPAQELEYTDPGDGYVGNEDSNAFYFVVGAQGQSVSSKPSNVVGEWDRELTAPRLMRRRQVMKPVPTTTRIEKE